ncbi:MAG TPA: hypothetical protein VHM28_01710 [Anaerolineales bacterium]|jgi:hypothetical protein|nr:hypothetical protein [Anaerolineales bacterium]
MKVIDKTPLQNDKGEMGLLERLQGTLKYGFSWYSELEAQKIIIAQLDRALEKGYILIRNLTLPGSEIVEPIILLGPPGVYVIYVTHLSGFYEARGDQWGTSNNGRFAPSSINLMSRVARLAKVLQVYIERQGVTLPKPIEATLIASSPAMHVESNRPAVRVVMSDAVKQFAASLLQAPPLMRSEFVYDLADRIVEPRPKAASPQPIPLTPPPQDESQSPSRAQAIFRASEEAKPFNPADMDFAFDETGSSPGQNAPTNVRETSPAQPLPRPAQNRGMKSWQWFFLGIMGIIECCVIGGFGYFLLFAKR